MNATGTRTGNRASHITSTLPLKRAIPAKTGMPTKRPQSNLVFLVDVSGSMGSNDKIGER